MFSVLARTDPDPTYPETEFRETQSRIPNRVLSRFCSSLFINTDLVETVEFEEIIRQERKYEEMLLLDFGVVEYDFESN